MLTYTITVTNISSVTADNVVVTDQMPSVVTFISATPSQGTCTGTTCNLGSLAPGAAAAIQYVVQVKDGAAPKFTNVACVATSTPESNMANNCDEEDTSVPPPPTAAATQTPKDLPVTGGLPGHDSGGSNGGLVVFLGLGALLAGFFVAVVARRRAEVRAE